MRKIIFASVVLGLIAAGQVPAASHPASYPLYAGKTMNAGTVSVTSDGTYIYVTFNTTGGWVLDATQVHLAGSLEDIPQTKSGNPIPGRFMEQHTALGAAVSDSYVFPIDDLGGEDVYVAAHATVVRLNGQRLQVEGAWAGDDDFPGKNWAKYIAIDATEWRTSGSGWSISGDWTVLLFNGKYPHWLDLAQDATGGLDGTGALMDGETQVFVVTVSGEVEGDAVTLYVEYPAYTGWPTLTLVGTIDETDGSMSGTCIAGSDPWGWDSTEGAAQEGSGGLWILP